MHMHVKSKPDQPMPVKRILTTEAGKHDYAVGFAILVDGVLHRFVDRAFIIPLHSSLPVLERLLAVSSSHEYHTRHPSPADNRESCEPAKGAAKRVRIRS